MPAHSVDAALALIVFLLGALAAGWIAAYRPPYYEPPEAAEAALAELIADFQFQQALYSNDTGLLRAYLNSVVPVNGSWELEVYDLSGGILLRLGARLEGVPAIAVLTGYNGTIGPEYVRIVSLKVEA